MKNLETTEDFLSRYTAQETLFSLNISRTSLLNIRTKTANTNKKYINIWRNHAFEPLTSIIDLYANYGGWHPEYWISSYDDTLLFTDYSKADVEILWLDTSRIRKETSTADWINWIDERISTLRNLTTAPIILATWWNSSDVITALQDLSNSKPSVYFADLLSTCRLEDIVLLDQRSMVMSGTPISSKAQLILARKLACHWLPAVLFPPVKAIALDLDNTLHQGVLGEDGIEGVQLTLKHKELQLYIKSLQKRGLFIALISRNEHQDVKKLFDHRKDYPLRWEDFSAIDVSWGEKSVALERISKNLRIGLDSIIFVDDNIGELISVAMQLPQVRSICAYTDATITQQSLFYYPGLWRWKINSDDAKRINDLKANTEREKLATDSSALTDYFQSLQITLDYYQNSSKHLTRLADLCSKTNQFNLSLRRFTEVELMEYMNRKDCCVVGVQLTDRLAESGIIAVIVAKRQDNTLLIEELCISCRALGRKLEDTIIIMAIKEMPIFSGCENITFQVQEGSRNQPALTWLSSLLQTANQLPASGCHHANIQDILKFSPISSITLRKFEF